MIWEPFDVVSRRFYLKTVFMHITTFIWNKSNDLKVFSYTRILRKKKDYYFSEFPETSIQLTISEINGNDQWILCSIICDNFFPHHLIQFGKNAVAIWSRCRHLFNVFYSVDLISFQCVAEKYEANIFYPGKMNYLYLFIQAFFVVVKYNFLFAKVLTLFECCAAVCMLHIIQIIRVQSVCYRDF